MQPPGFDQPLDTGARISQELLQLTDRDNAMLPSSEVRQVTPPLVRSTCVNPRPSAVDLRYP